jgi:hypothetical protein
MTSTTDFKTEIDTYRARPARFPIVGVPDLHYLMIDGHGDPSTGPAFADDEAETLSRMHHEFIPANGLRMTGRHHEIYLSDARRVTPEKLRTILRQPVSEVVPVD